MWARRSCTGGPGSECALACGGAVSAVAVTLLKVARASVSSASVSASSCDGSGGHADAMAGSWIHITWRLVNYEPQLGERGPELVAVAVQTAEHRESLG